MSFLFATEEELGYDPMVTRDAKGDYIYRIPSTEGGQQRDRFFRTTASIAEYRSNNITGRMARVWKVVECNSNGDVLSPSEPSRVLKDVWLEDSALTESQIQSQIFEDLKKFFVDKQDERYLAFEKLQPSLSDLEKDDAYKKYFIKIVTDYEGKRTKPLFPGSPRVRRLFTTIKPLALPITSNRGGSGTPRPTESKTTFDKGLRGFAPRKQYRVIFGEVCEAVGDLGTVGEVADVLTQAVVALRLMYCAGWVHRDISSGNILAHCSSPSSGWQAKLSDLEYAQRFAPDLDRNAASDPKTGTPYFMPHEILTSSYIPNVVPGNHSDEMPDFDQAIPSNNPEYGHVVVYNFQHDLESVWWILLWSATSRVSHTPSIDWSRDIFRNTMTPSQARLDCLLLSIAATLKANLHPSLQSFVAPLEVLRTNIYTEYIERRNVQAMSDHTSYIRIHRIFDAFFNSIRRTRATWGGAALQSGVLITVHPPLSRTTMVSPPKPWERPGAAVAASSSALPQTPAATSSSLAASSSQSQASNSQIPTVPERPASLPPSAGAMNQSSLLPGATSAMTSPYSSPYSRLGSYGTGYGAGTGYGGLGSYGSSYGGLGSYGGYGSYGGMGGMGMGGMGGFGGYNSFGGGYGGMGGGYGMPMMGGPPGMAVDPVTGQPIASLTQTLESTTHHTFALLHSIVQTFSGVAQMLESTFMATHSSFFSMVGVIDQFSQLRNALGSVLGLFGLVRWMRDLLTGRRSAGGLRSEFRDFVTGRPVPSAAPGSSQPNTPRPSKKPLIIFLLAIFGIPLAMTKLIRMLSERAAAQGQLTMPNGAPLPPLDPSMLTFARALYPFTASSQAELSLKENEIVAIMGKLDPRTGQEVDPRIELRDGDKVIEADWWKGRTRDGREGWFPRKWAEVLERRQPVAPKTVDSA
ncbi:Peroxisomal membrane protein PAS20 [Pleurotus pulmonarius]|nr:Peroxisomal membrane protein PAS20 [Pleurotus pulmonarius]